MELGLNTLWCLLAVASFVLVGWGAERRRLASWDSLRQALALACALVIFFPIISLTDDLHAASVVIEDSNPLKRISKRSGAAGTSRGGESSQHPFVVVTGGWPGLLPLATFGWTVPLQVFLLAAAPSEWPHFRGPPWQILAHLCGRAS